MFHSVIKNIQFIWLSGQALEYCQCTLIALSSNTLNHINCCPNYSYLNNHISENMLYRYEAEREENIKPHCGVKWDINQNKCSIHKNDH